MVSWPGSSGASAAGDDADNIDFAEGALTAVSNQAVTLATPFAGILEIPRDLLKKLVVQGEGRRIVFDPCATIWATSFPQTCHFLTRRSPREACSNVRSN